MRAVTVSLLAVLAAAALAAPARAADNPWLAKRVLNIAHQGGEDEFPSNTLYAFKKAKKAGADMLELDIGVCGKARMTCLSVGTLKSPRV